MSVAGGIRLALASALLLLGSCREPVDNSRLRVAAILVGDSSDFRVGRLPLDHGTALLRAGVAQGLVSFGPDGEIRPALAERWIVTDDGMSYIFRLGNARWNDGSEVEAREVAQAFRERMRDLRKSRFRADLAAIAEVVPMTGNVLEIRMAELRPSFLNLIAQPEFGLVYRGNGSGPMKASEREEAMQLQHRGRDEDGNEQLVDPVVTLHSTDAARAMVQFRHRERDLVLNGRFQHLPLLNEADIANSQIRFDAVTGLFGFVVTSKDGFLTLARNREAVAMAIDRPRMLTSFETVVWRESVSISPVELQNRSPIDPPAWTRLDRDERIDEARRRVRDWHGEGSARKPIRVAMPEGAGARVLYARLKADLAEIGLETRLAEKGKQADLLLIDEVADYDSPLWYLSRLSCAYLDPCSEEVETLFKAARAARNVDERTDLLGKAEQSLMAQSLYIPLAMPVRFSLAREGLFGFEPNYRGWHLLQYLGDIPDRN